MTISKTFDSLKQAERHQNGLYAKYYRVELVSAPMFSEVGVYRREVDDAASPSRPEAELVSL